MKAADSVVYPRVRPYNERSILVEFKPNIGSSTLSELLFVKNLLENFYIKQKVEIINAYSSILIKYDLTIDKIYSEVSVVKEVVSAPFVPLDKDFKTWRIPVCYDSKFGTDLDAISQDKKMTKEEIIELHSNGRYTVYFIGFLPGFLYLGGLDKKLCTPRKSIPNLNVKKGSVAIGGQQTGIYPQDSPGGWHVIGSTPVPFFDPHLNPPCFATNNDVVKFKPITTEHYHYLQNEVEQNRYNWEKILEND
ncbi:5-oxoprolinase subunit PxpB [Aegicerativicinus sediminis]|uniref:5-oxoprolinase subunit PxpB n=1 Tax=Aegicerativicinus sediminis TaxID=2893202 RepID=UPI001E589D2C|nr:5-oxoprolinase subunit PxpB [Aegicerativicinus sediminis]